MNYCIYGGPTPCNINPDWPDHDTDFIVCLINGERKKKIEKRYLAKLGWTKERYLEAFPDAPLLSHTTRNYLAQKTPMRLAVRKQIMTCLNQDATFQIARIKGCIDFMESDDSRALRKMLSEKAKRQHREGLADILRQKYFAQLTDEKRAKLRACQAMAFTEFVSRARQIHGNSYDYVENSYRNCSSKVEIVCSDHGLFEQNGRNHLNGAKCPFCSHYVSRMETAWLDGLGVPERQKFIALRPFRKRGSTVDGFDPITNTVYQFHEDFWHGNPAMYDPNDWNPRTKSNFGDLYQKTLEIDEAIRLAGYNLVVMWETNWRLLQV